MKKKILTLDTMITPQIALLCYWVALLICVLSGLNTMFFNEQINVISIGRGFGIIVFGALISRIACEFIIVIFTISSDLKAVSTFIKTQK